MYALCLDYKMRLIVFDLYKQSPEYRKINIGIYVASVVVFVGALWLVRTQATVDDRSYMRSMIPHHSIAINNAERASISDPRVRKLADGIIESQVREIAIMKLLIEDIDRNGERGTNEIAARTAEVTPEMELAIKEALK